MKIIFVTKRGKEAYGSLKHLNRIWNFLYWHNDKMEDALLLVGNGDYGMLEASHRNLLICAEKNGCIVPQRLMDGAGRVDEGKVISWVSTGFMVTTPENIRPLIRAALGVE